ncbi:hypothetical protein CDAR_216031 [Caerostris darwini]|uniref:Uncharacterized protein n=1 Tax=Caerostris darwini TaxID=1538125 RepID=A0AAV4MP52_9ARAC|nr:hypothetical protein CDAR_216031 [Caerostris darwini]
MWPKISLPLCCPNTARSATTSLSVWWTLMRMRVVSVSRPDPFFKESISPGDISRGLDAGAGDHITVTKVREIQLVKSPSRRYKPNYFKTALVLLYLFQSRFFWGKYVTYSRDVTKDFHSVVQSRPEAQRLLCQSGDFDAKEGYIRPLFEKEY